MTAIRAVLFDFHGTLAQLEPDRDWLSAALATVGVSLDPSRFDSVLAGLLAAGRAGVTEPAHAPPALEPDYRRRHLDGAAHRRSYVGLLETAGTGIDGLADALYDRLRAPHGWVAYPDAVSTLASLRRHDIRTAVVSNTGYDIRPVGVAVGFAPLIETWALSVEVGAMKPDSRLFGAACDELAVAPDECLMVGDTPADAGAVALGIRTLVLPADPPGVCHGLDAVLALCRATGPS